MPCRKWLGVAPLTGGDWGKVYIEKVQKESKAKKKTKQNKLLGWSLSGCLVWESLAVIGCSQISLSQIQVNSGLVSRLWLSFFLAYGGYQGIGVTSV